MVVIVGVVVFVVVIIVVGESGLKKENRRRRLMVTPTDRPTNSAIIEQSAFSKVRKEEKKQRFAISLDWL